MNEDKTIDEQLEDFEKTPKFLKIRILAMALKFEEILAEENAVMKSLYKDGQGHSVVFTAGDIAVLENTIKPSFPDATFTVAVKTDGKWRATSHYFATADNALLHGIGVKHEGINSRFANYAIKMLKD